MSNPAGKCVFCGGTGLTKGHIWPKWVQSILPSKATHHEQIIGHMDTFTPKMAVAPYWKRLHQGPVGSRKPRNTCKTCNSGWMSAIEGAAKTATMQLVLGNGFILTTLHQRLLASFLCLVSMRIELGGTIMRAIPQRDLDFLRQTFQPNKSWRIWIARYEGTPTEDHRQ